MITEQQLAILNGYNERIDFIIKNYYTPVKERKASDFPEIILTDIQVETQGYIAEYIHRNVKEILHIPYDKFLEKIECGKVREFFENNREFDEKYGDEAPKYIQEHLQQISKNEELSEKIYRTILDFEEVFGRPPGDPNTLSENCATHDDLAGLIYKSLGFNCYSGYIPNHTVILVEVGNETFVSDVNVDELLPLSKWEKKYGKLVLGYRGAHDASLHVNLGNFLINLNRHKEAEKEYREAIKIDPNHVCAHYNLGNLLQNLKRYEEAEKSYREAIRINPNDAEAHNNLGVLLADLKRYEEAEKEFREAIRLNPDYAYAHNNLGNLLSDLKRYEEAEKEYREAIKLNPNFAGAHTNLGLLLQNLNRYEEAEKEYREAIRINPNYAEAHNNLGLLLKDLNRYVEAEKEYKEALRINPNLAEANYNLKLLKRINPAYSEDVCNNFGRMFGDKSANI